MAASQDKRRKARAKRKSIKSRRKREYSNLIIAAPIIAVIVVLLLIYGPFGGNNLAPDFTLVDVQGRGQFTLSEHQGEVVFIEFFSTTCSHCEEYQPTVQQIRTLFKTEELTMISISVSWAHEEGPQVLEYAEEMGIRWYITLDTSSVTDLYDIGSTPTTIIVNKSGNIEFRRSGLVSASTLRSEIEALL